MCWLKRWLTLKRSLTPSTQLRLLTITGNFNSRASNTLFSCPWHCTNMHKYPPSSFSHTCACTHSLTHTHTQLKVQIKSENTYTGGGREGVKGERSGKITPSVKGLPCKHGDLSLTSQKLCLKRKSQAWRSTAVILALGKQRHHSPGACC